MKKWPKFLSMLLVTPLLLLSSLDCTEGRDEDSKFFGSVDGIVHRGSSAQSDTGKIVAKKMGAAGQVVCSISTSPDQMVLMFQHLHGNYTLDELAGMDILFWTLKSPNISKGALVEPELKKFQIC